MADDRMKNDDDLQRNMGANREDQDYGQQSPGRGGQGANKQQPGQQAGGQQGGQKDSLHHNMEEDDDLGAGRGQGGTQNRGGQNR